MSENSSTLGVILAAGSSKRFGENKLMAKLNNKPVLAYALQEFNKSQFISAVIVVTSESIKSDIILLAEKYLTDKLYNVILGGKTRQESVKNALESIIKQGINCSYVSVHDGARPLLSYKDIDRCIQGAVKSRASTIAIRPKDTIKQSDSPFSKNIVKTHPRELLWAIQTPQAFEFNLLYEGHSIALKDKFVTTDDCAIVERIGIVPCVIEGDYRNIKITTPEDILIAEVLLKNIQETSNK